MSETKQSLKATGSHDFSSRFLFLSRSFSKNTLFDSLVDQVLILVFTSSLFLTKRYCMSLQRAYKHSDGVVAQRYDYTYKWLQPKCVHQFFLTLSLASRYIFNDAVNKCERFYVSVCIKTCNILANIWK